MSAKLAMKRCEIEKNTYLQIILRTEGLIIIKEIMRGA